MLRSGRSRELIRNQLEICLSKCRGRTGLRQQSRRLKLFKLIAAWQTKTGTKPRRQQSRLQSSSLSPNQSTARKPLPPSSTPHPNPSSKSNLSHSPTPPLPPTGQNTEPPSPNQSPSNCRKRANLAHPHIPSPPFRSSHPLSADRFTTTRCQRSRRRRRERGRKRGDIWITPGE